MEVVFRIEITVNKARFPWDRKTISGLEVLDLAHESKEQFDVYVKRKGHDDKIKPDEFINVEDAENRHFRTVPKEVTEG